MSILSIPDVTIPKINVQEAITAEDLSKKYKEVYDETANEYEKGLGELGERKTLAQTHLDQITEGSSLEKKELTELAKKVKSYSETFTRELSKQKQCIELKKSYDDAIEYLKPKLATLENTQLSVLDAEMSKKQTAAKQAFDQMVKQQKHLGTLQLHYEKNLLDLHKVLYPLIRQVNQKSGVYSEKGWGEWAAKGVAAYTIYWSNPNYYNYPELPKIEAEGS